MWPRSCEGWKPRSSSVHWRYCFHWRACKRHVLQGLDLKDACDILYGSLTEPPLETILARPSGRSSLIPQKTMEMKANIHTNVWIFMATAGLVLFTDLNYPSNKGSALRCCQGSWMASMLTPTDLVSTAIEKAKNVVSEQKLWKRLAGAKEHTLNYDICK